MDSDGHRAQRVTSDAPRKPTDVSFIRENSRARARKGHEPQTFLSIGEPGEETAVTKDGGLKPATLDGLGGKRAAAGAGGKPAAAGPAPAVKRPHPVAAGAAAPATAVSAPEEAPVTASRSASTQRSSSRFNDSFASFERPAARSSSRRAEQRPLATPETAGVYVTAPFKQDVTRGSSVAKKVVSPGAGLKEATLIATMEVSRAIKEDAQKSRQLLAAAIGRATPAREPRLLKAPMQPLVAVRRDGPGIEQCRGVQAAAPWATPQSALLDVSGELASRSDTRIKSSGLSRPSTDGGRQASAAPSIQGQRSALRRTSANRSEGAKINGSPAPRNSVDEGDDESSKQLDARALEQPREARAHVQVPSAHSSVDSKSVHSTAVPENVRSAEADDNDSNPRPSSSWSDGSRQRASRGLTFLTENNSTERDVAIDNKLLATPSDAASRLPSPTVANADLDQAQERSSCSASPESTGRAASRTALSTDASAAAPRSGVAASDNLVRNGTVNGEIRWGDVAGIDIGHPITDQQSHVMQTVSSVNSGSKIVDLDDVESESKGASAQTLQDSRDDPTSAVATEDAPARALALRKSEEKHGRCKDTATDSPNRRRSSDDDEGDGDGVNDKRQPGARGSLTLDGSTSAFRGLSSQTASGDNHAGAKGDGEATEATIANSLFLSSEKGYLSLQTQLASIIAELRLQRGAGACALKAADWAVVAVDSDSAGRRVTGHDLARTNLADISLQSKTSMPNDAAISSKAENDNENLSICLLHTVQDQTTYHGDPILLNRDHKPSDIYRDLFYHGWGTADLTTSCFSEHLTRPVARTALSRQRGRKSAKQHAWESNDSLTGVQVPSRLSSAAGAASAEDKRRAAVAGSAEESESEQLCVRPSAYTAEERLSHGAAGSVPPPLCFGVNAKPPAGRFYYFSYGMHMNADRLGASLGRAVDDFRLWGLLFGFQLMFNKKGVDEQAGLFPNIEYNPLSSVEGCVYRLTEGDLALLDGYHGYPAHYARAVLPVWVVNCLDPDNYGVAQYCVPAVAYVAQDRWVANVSKSGGGSRDYSVRQCLKSADLLTSNYRRQLLSMCSR